MKNKVENEKEVSFLVRSEAEFAQRVEKYVKDHGAKGWRKKSGKVDGFLSKIVVAIKY